MTFWKAQGFKELQKAWYQRLEDEGFQDAEKNVGDEMVLRQFSSHRYKGTDELSRGIKAAYFSILSGKIHEAEFASEVDRLIMTWHADGKMIKVICEELERRGQRRHEKTIRFTIRKYEMAWGMREYSPIMLNRVGR